MQHLLWILLCCRCDDQMARKLVTCFMDGADTCTLAELEARVATLSDQLGSETCGRRAVRPPGEEVS